MCGIAGIHIKRPGSLSLGQLERLTDHLLLGIEPRGDDATGMVVAGVGGKGVQLSKEALPASQFIRQRPKLIDTTIRTILLHTRYATQGHQSNNLNNHPVVSGTTFAIHNGHINNDAELFQEHELERRGEVDSEIIAALINKHGLDSLSESVELLNGGFAIAAIDPSSYPDLTMFAKGRNSPFIFFENSDFLIFASLHEAIENAWGAAIGTPPDEGKFYYLKEGFMLTLQGENKSVVDTFVVKEPVYKYSGTTSYGTTSYGPYGTSKNTQHQNNRAMCECGHTKFWHRGSSYSQDCLVKSKDDDPKDCGCTAYVFDQVKTEDEGLIMCDGCFNYFTIHQLDYLKNGNYFVCYLCDDVDVDAAWSIYTRVPGTTLGTTPQLTLLRGSDAEEEAEECVVGEALDLDAIYNDAELRHKYLLEQTAKLTGNYVAFVDWVLFKAAPEMIEGSAFLEGKREECDIVYTEFEAELEEWMEDDSFSFVNAEVLAALPVGGVA